MPAYIYLCVYIHILHVASTLKEDHCISSHCLVLLHGIFLKIVFLCVCKICALFQKVKETQPGLAVLKNIHMFMCPL